LQIIKNLQSLALEVFMQVIDWLLTLPSFALEIKKGFIFAYRAENTE
jgi:hypothetical protein